MGDKYQEKLLELLLEVRDRVSKLERSNKELNRQIADLEKDAKKRELTISKLITMNKQTNSKVVNLKERLSSAESNIRNIASKR